MVSDPADAEQVAAALGAWAQRTYGGAVSVAEGPTAITGGYDTYIYRFRLGGPVEGLAAAPLILRLYPSPERGPSALREAEILRYLAAADYPAPRPLEASGASDEFGVPYVVMEQVPGRTIVDLAARAPVQALADLDALATMQARLHQLDPGGWPFPADPGVWEVDRRLAEADMDGSVPDRDLERALTWLRENRSVAEGHGPSICHFDFHPVNALRSEAGDLAIVDWEGAGIGDRHSDLAHTLVLFEFAQAIATKRVERVVLRVVNRWLPGRYRRAYARHLPVEEDRLRYWMALHTARRWSEAVQLRTGTFARETRTDLRVGLAAAVEPRLARLFRRLVPEA